MLCISQNCGSWFGLDNRPWQFVRSRKWWGGVRDGWKYGWRCLMVCSSRVRLIKFWNIDFLLNFMNVASIFFVKILSHGVKNAAYFCLIKHRSLWEDYLVVCPRMFSWKRFWQKSQVQIQKFCIWWAKQ